METTTTRKPSLPVVLENIRIAMPCSADWDDMSGDDRVRFCGKCEKNVYNLSAMTREAGEALVQEKEGRLRPPDRRGAAGRLLAGPWSASAW